MHFISLKRLAALDMSYNGRWLVTVEFAVGVLGIAALAVLLSSALPAWFAAWLWGISANYVPLLAWAIRLGTRGQYQEIASKITDPRRYNRQQFLVAIPFLLLLLGIWQRWAVQERV